MKRRTFLELAGMGLLGGLATPKLHAAAGSEAVATASGDAADAYGSGHFGKWVRDAFGLPAYQYECNQITDPKATQPVNTAWRSKTDHIHQMGNDRVVVQTSNYGYVQVRQDEGSPKFLNDIYPAENRYGGGVGFLADGERLLSTYYTGKAERFERTLGAGYFRKRVMEKQYEVDQVIFAPFGDDPVLISQVTVTNQSSEARRARWVEYWGCHHYQFSYRFLMEGAVQGSADGTPQLRREFSSRFVHEFEKARGGAGLVERQTYPGRAPEEEDAWKKVQASLTADPNGFYGGPVPALPAGSAMEDLHPPATFLASLDAPADGYATNAGKFFAGGIENPGGMRAPLDNDASTTGPESAFFLERKLVLKPGESRTLYFLYGYLPEGFTYDGLVAKYASDPAGHLRRSCARWKASGIKFRAPGEKWIEREIAWSGAFLRSGFTYDSYFREHILSQGAGYQYLAGLQGAARDPLQHVLPFVYTDPELVRQVLRFTLKEVAADGSIPYGIVGSGVPMPCRYRPSDGQLWVLWVAAEYVLATRDADFLKQRIAPAPRQEANAGDPTVLELLERCRKFLVVTQGNGKHGLMRMSNGDWNDSIVVNRLTPEQVADATQHGESVLNAAMAGYVFDYYGEMLDAIGENAPAAEARKDAEAQRAAVRAQWNGRWFKRAWLGEGLGWNGEKQLWLEPQPWAILGGAATEEQRKTLVAAIDEMARKPSAIGALLQSPADLTMKDEPGTGTNGGIFAAINGTLIWALATVDGEMAWDEWKKNTLARHAEMYPDLWYGIWSGPDAYDSVLSKHPGGTAPDFPVLNMHAHAWPIYSLIKLLGVEFHRKGLRLRTAVPLPEYEFESSLLGFSKSANGYAGWYAPTRAGRWEIEVSIPPAPAGKKWHVRVNGAHSSLTQSDATVAIQGESRPGVPLRWEITAQA